MSIKLFEHNQTAYESAIKMLAERGKTAVVHPTGTGKSFIGFKLCEDNPDKIICWLSPSRYIYQTQLENLAETSNGYQPDNIRFFTYAKLMLLSDEELSEIQPDYIILDEFHRCGAEYWGMGVHKLLKMHPDTKILGLSATAIRYLDNQRNMTDELFDGNIASEMTLGEAVVRGILNPPKYILSVFSYQKDLEKYEKRVKSARSKAVRDTATAYLESLRRALDKAEKLDVLFDKHMEDRNGKYIVFCANLEHMQEMICLANDWFRHVDQNPHIYSVYSDDPTASKSFADFKADNSEHLKLLYCIDALNEGVHIENISGVILLRPTVSPIIYKQQIGRALSASKSKNPVIFDIINNIENLYSIDTIEEEMQSAVIYYRSTGKNSLIVNENFEVIDKVADCKVLFDELEGTLSASWDTMYELAKEYYENHGNLDVLSRYYTDEGYSLGTWIITQRRIYKGTVPGALTQAQVDKLNEIGMIWDDVRDRSWKKYYPSAQKYYEKFGNLNVLNNYVDDDGIDLGRWINQIRSYHKSGIRLKFLTPDRIAELDKIGMIWDTVDFYFENNFHSALMYYKQNGNLNVPSDYVDENGVRLGEWIKRIRDRRKNPDNRMWTLTDEQIARLDSIGMIWDNRTDVKWNSKYRELFEYKAEFGDVYPPRNYITPKGTKLGAWVEQQRKSLLKNSIFPERAEKLAEIGFTAVKETKWEKAFRCIKKYFDEHNNIDIPADYEAEGINLHNWLNQQRKSAKNGKLSAEKLSMFGQLGFETENNRQQEKWLLHLEQAREYLRKNGNINIPKDYITGDGFSLGAWFQTQKNDFRAGKLSEERKRLLIEIGITESELSGTQSEKAWANGIRHLREYMQNGGIQSGAAKYVCDDGYRLDLWFAATRNKFYKGLLSDEQVQQLTETGIAFSKKNTWLEYFKEVKSYFETHGTDSIPVSYISESGIKLSQWLADQKRRYKKGQLLEECADMLRGVGIKI